MISGYLISLLPKDHLENLITYNLTLSAKDVKTVNFQVGVFEDDALYESLLYIQNVITNRSYDLRLLTLGGNGEYKLR
jgi:hypothetical protein